MIQLRVSQQQFEQLSDIEQFDIVCDAFERDYRQGTAFPLSHYVGLVSETLSKRLYHELALVGREVDETVAGTSTFQSKRHGDSSRSRQGQGISNSLPMRFDNFLLTEELGRGASGVVYRAQDLDLGVEYAIKLPHAEYTSESFDSSEFMREAKHASKLAHAGIVRVHRVGEWQGIPYILSDLVIGRNLKLWIHELHAHGEKQRDDWVQIARFISDLANALQHAHDRGIIHRDVKPSNILIQTVDHDPSGNLLKPVLLDFGVSKMLSLGTRSTKEGDLLGTPAYMSPEQASGKSASADARTDVYSLGVVLYELLTGTIPFKGNSFDILAQIRAGHVLPVRDINAMIPEGLSSICHHCLENAPADRYQSAADLALDLDRWLRNIPLSKKRKSRPSHAAPFPNAKLAMAAVAGLVAIAALATFYPDPTPTTPMGLLDGGLLNGDREMTVASSGNADTWIENLTDSSASRVLLKERIQELDPAKLPAMGVELQNNLHAQEHLKQLLKPNPSLTDGDRLRLAVVQATAFPSVSDGAIFDRISKWILTAVTPSEVGSWIRGLKKIGPALEAPLLEQYIRSEDKEPRAIAAQILSEMLAENADLLLQAIEAADPYELQIWAKQAWNRREWFVPLIRSRWQSELNRIIDDTLLAEEKKDIQAKEKELEAQSIPIANLLLVSYALGDHEAISTPLSGTKHPSVQTHFIHRLPQTGFPTELLEEKLLTETDPSVLRNQILALGLCECDTRPVLDWARQAYMQHPNAGVHSACLWYLHRNHQNDFLVGAQSQLIAEGIVPGRNWHVSPSGLLFAHFEAPREVTIGRSDGQVNSRLEVKRVGFTSERFALAAFSLGQLKIDNALLGVLSSTSLPYESNIGGVPSLSKFAEVCERLSEREGSFHAANSAMVQFDSGLTVYLNRSGYRPPTEAEMEIASMSEVQRTTFFGSQNPQIAEAYETRQSAQIPIPNQGGLFGVLTELGEWVVPLFDQIGYSNEIVVQSKHSCLVTNFNLKKLAVTNLMQIPPGHTKNAFALRLCSSLIEKQ